MNTVRGAKRIIPFALLSIPSALMILLSCRTPLPGPEPVRLRSPAPDSAVGSGEVIFAWDSVSDAASYELQIDDRSSFYTPVFETSAVTGTTLSHFLTDGSYYWRMRAWGRDSALSEWSATWTFRVESYRIIAQMRTRGYPQNLVLHNDQAYVADGQAGLSIFRIGDAAPPSIALVASIMDTTNSAYGVSIQGHYAYLAYGRKQLQIVDIAELESLRMLGNISYTTGYGYGIQALDTTLVVVANHGKFSIFDVRDPNFPILLYEPHAMCRDVSVHDSIAYLACEQTGVLVMRFSSGNPPEALGGIQTAENARALTVVDGICYVADGRAGLTLVDIHDPADPQMLSTLPIRSGYANRVTVSDGIAYVAAGSAGLATVDVSVPTDPRLLGMVKTPYAKAVAVTDAGRVLVADRDWGLVLLEKVSD